MTTIEVILALLPIKLVVALLLLRRWTGEQPKPKEKSWAESEPITKVISLHPATRPRRRPF